jgi:hypothetical protein
MGEWKLNRRQPIPRGGKASLIARAATSAFNTFGSGCFGGCPPANLFCQTPFEG